MKKRLARPTQLETIQKETLMPLTALQAELSAVDARIEMIQALIPLGLQAVEEELLAEVSRLTGEKNSRKGQNSRRRWGKQRGSVYLSDQKLPLQVPRVRDVQQNQEVPLEVYQRFQTPRKMDEGLLLRVLRGLSTRSYEACAEAVPEAFGLSPSTVSRRFIQASAAKLRHFQERSLHSYDLVALFIDGKTFADEEMIIALGITIEGHKIPLGFVQAATENERVCRDFINRLIQRGLQYEQGLLVVIDGSKGFYAAVTKALKGFVALQRCQWHKRENVVSYLAKNQQDEVRKTLQDAYELEGYQEARAALHALRPTLKVMNESALGSLEEGLEETLTIHRLGLMPFLKKSFRTTNCIESLNSMVEQVTDHVKRWTNSNQRCRWLGAALLDIQPRLRRVKGYRYLPLLRQALQKELKLQPKTERSYPLSAD